MRKKKGSVCLAAILLLILCAGCSLLTGRVRRDRNFEIEDYGITFTAAGDWEEVEDTPFDIQITNSKSYLGIMAYGEQDLFPEQTAQEVYDWQNSDLFSRRENVEVVEQYQEYHAGGKTIGSTMFSAERDKNQNYYLSCLVRFDNRDDIFAFVMITGTPSYIQNSREDLLGILETLELSDASASSISSIS